MLLYEFYHLYKITNTGRNVWDACIEIMDEERIFGMSSRKDSKSVFGICEDFNRVITREERIDEKIAEKNLNVKIEFFHSNRSSKHQTRFNRGRSR